MKRKTNRIREKCQKHDYIILIIGTILYELIIYLFNNISNIKEITMFIYLLTILILLFNKKNPSKNIFYILYIIGVIFRTKYITNTSIYDDYQHDVFGINDAPGHLDYIIQLFTHYKLPSHITWQYYHPPFWHAIAAIWLKIISLFKTNFNLDIDIESLKILTLCFSSFIIIICDKICYKLKFKNFYRILTDAIFVIHPTLIYLSGSINNDCLVTFLEFLTILFLINWYEETTWKNTIILAITTGLCVMTKYNGVLMAVPIMYLFILKLLSYIKNNKSQIKLYIHKILTFGFISIPIGLWYQIRNFILFGEIAKIPGYYNPLDINFITEKLFSFNIKEVMNYALDSDVNLPAFIIKSSIFGAWDFYNINKLKEIIIIINIIFITMSVIFIIGYLFYKKKNIYMNTLLITWIVYMISMYIFNYNYPETCTMDFRFIVICLLPGIMIISYIINDNKKIILKILFILLYCSFIITSAIINYKIH